VIYGEIITSQRPFDVPWTWLNPSSRQRTCLDSADLGEPHGVGDGQVSVQRDAAEEGDADVDVGVEDEAEQLATLLAVDPVVVLQEVVDPQRQRGDVQQVGHRQVDQVHAQLVALPHLGFRPGIRIRIRMRSDLVLSNMIALRLLLDLIG